jgi:hypothetical protein
MSKSISFIDWYTLCDSFSNIKHHASGTTRRVQAQDGRRRKKEGWSTKGFKENFSGLVTIALRILYSFCTQSRMILHASIEIILGVYMLNSVAVL